MNKIRLLTIAVIVLVAANLYILFMFRPGHGPGPGQGPKERGPKNMIIKKLHFNDQQIKDYEALIELHQAAIAEADKEVRQTKNELYRSLAFDSPQEENAALIISLSEIQEKIELIHYNHFLDLKALCKDEQKADFDKLTLEIADLFAGPEKRRRR